MRDKLGYYHGQITKQFQVLIHPFYPLLQGVREGDVQFPDGAYRVIQYIVLDHARYSTVYYSTVQYSTVQGHTVHCPG